MNQESINGHGGAHIKPSARKSIHSDCVACTALNRKNMGRYGVEIGRKNEQIWPSKNHVDPQHQGYDEVDNVMSKMARQASPVPMRRNNIPCRRNSYDVNNDEYSDEESDEISILSKSSPAGFSLYSDEIYASANATLEENHLQNSRNVSAHDISREGQRRYNRSTNNLHIQSSTSKQTNMFSQSIPVFLLLLCIIIAVFYRVYYPSETIKMNSIYDKIRFYTDVNNLGEKYKVKDTSILQVRTGIATIFEKQDTGSFIFAYNSRVDNFNPIKLNNFIEDIASTASRYLRNDSEVAHHVVVDTVNLRMQTEKEFMNTFEDGVANTGVMLVRDIDNVPSQLAMAFHYYCDEYNPLVRRSAIFFTLNLAKCPNNSDPKSTHKYIEKCLAKKWGAVGEDKIGPLLTRVVNIVVDVTSIV